MDIKYDVFRSHLWRGQGEVMPGQAWVNKMTRLNIWEAMHIRCV